MYGGGRGVRRPSPRPHFVERFTRVKAAFGLNTRVGRRHC
jgi:hypothetical protein